MTISTEHAASAPPRRPPATHSRAGNGMARTREAALSGAVRAVAARGVRKTTMGDIATFAGIAKATLYNHFRTRDDVFRAVLEFEVERVAEAALQRRDDGAAAVLEEAARLLAEHPALRSIARDEPAVLAALAAIDDTSIWTLARQRISAVLDGGSREAGPASVDPASVDLVLRFLVSQLTSPATPPQRRAGAQLLAAACGR